MRKSIHMFLGLVALLALSGCVSTPMGPSAPSTAMNTEFCKHDANNALVRAKSSFNLYSYEYWFNVPSDVKEQIEKKAYDL